MTFTVDYVLTAEHSLYQPEHPGEYACFRRGELRFQAVKNLYWTGQGRPPAEDADGEIDYGHIESFGWESSYQLHGGWGYMEITGGDVQVTIAEAGSSPNREAQAARVGR